VVFHFNKGHLADPTIPMWVIKTYGKTFYIEHVECAVPWSTKETPDNASTKGSIKIKNCLLTIDQENVAHITAPTDKDRLRLKDQSWNTHRIIFSDSEFSQVLTNENIEHTPIKTMGGGCGTLWRICDILNAQQFTLLALKYQNRFRLLSANEVYYQYYDRNHSSNHIAIDDEYDDYYEE
jgi:hypothetical protein